MRDAVRYLWTLWYGRLAALMVVVGVIGLTVHYWAPIVLVGAIEMPARERGVASLLLELALLNLRILAMRAAWATPVRLHRP